MQEIQRSEDFVAISESPLWVRLADEYAAHDGISTMYDGHGMIIIHDRTVSFHYCEKKQLVESEPFGDDDECCFYGDFPTDNCANMIGNLLADHQRTNDLDYTEFAQYVALFLVDQYE